jgi:hypothetical protein
MLLCARSLREHAGGLNRAALLAISVVVVAAVGFADRTASGRPAGPKPLTVGCGNIVGSNHAPGVQIGYRVVLGVVSAPPARLQKGGSNPGRWPYFSKAGLGVHASRGPVTITVPPAWRTRVAIGWGNNIGTSSTIRITRCPPAPGRWNFYAGGFFTRSATVCVPLTFRIGARMRTIRFGVGTRCGRP